MKPFTSITREDAGFTVQEEKPEKTIIPSSGCHAEENHFCMAGKVRPGALA